MYRSVLLFLLLLTIGFPDHVFAQKNHAKTTTIILLRHAEKDTSGGNNPPLSVQGIARAQRLSASFPNVVPDQFYSTAYTRTIETLKPWAQATGLEIKTYDPASLLELSDKLLKEKGKTIVVVGHSNTIPATVNLLIGAIKYAPLADTEYNTIYVVTIENGKAKEKVLYY